MCILEFKIENIPVRTITKIQELRYVFFTTLNRAIRGAEKMKKSIVLKIIYTILIISMLVGCKAIVPSPVNDVRGEYVKITAKEASELMLDEAVLVVDVRTKGEFKEGYIANAINIPVEDIQAGTAVLPEDKERTILLYCRSGNRSAVASNILIDAGYLDVRDFGGIIDWPYDIVVPKDLTVAEAANNILKLLKYKDMYQLSFHINQEKGLRLTPYSYVDTENDVIIRQDEIPSMLEDDSKHIFGVYDGTGEPIELTMRDYYDKFIYDKDFIEAPITGENSVIAMGNSINNIQEVYPDAFFKEYHFPGFDPQYGGLDWESLILVLEKTDSGYDLVGIVHASWTI